MALNDSSRDNAIEIFQQLDWYPLNASLDRTRDDSESARAAATRGRTVELQQPAIPLTPQSSSRRSGSPQSVNPQLPVDIELLTVPADSTSNHARVTTQDPPDLVVK